MCHKTATKLGDRASMEATKIGQQECHKHGGTKTTLKREKSFYDWERLLVKNYMI